MNTKASIVTIGDEILLGQIVDTNSTFIARELTQIGIEVHEILSIQDEVEAITNMFNQSLSKSDIIIVTGGLGPTKDDKTKQALCQFLDCDLREEPKVLENILSLFAARGKSDLNQLNREQALIPEKSNFIQNTLGTAPCLWTEINQKIIVNLPGVPYEMKALMREEILPRIQQQYETEFIVHRSVLMSGIAESDLALLIADWENQLPKHLHLAYLPTRTSIELRLTISGQDQTELENTIQAEIQKLKPIVIPFMLSENSGSAMMVLGDLLNHSKLSIASAESCTGGFIANQLTSIPGSSSYYKGSVVAYDASVKIAVLGVNQNDVEQYTVVSKEVVEQMAFGAHQKLGATLAIATTGVAGPSKGEDGKEVGTVWVSITNGKDYLTKMYFYPFLEREDFIKIVSNNALNLTIQFVQKNYK